MVIWRDFSFFGALFGLVIFHYLNDPSLKTAVFFPLHKVGWGRWAIFVPILWKFSGIYMFFTFRRALFAGVMQ